MLKILFHIQVVVMGRITKSPVRPMERTTIEHERSELTHMAINATTDISMVHNESLI